MPFTNGTRAHVCAFALLTLSACAAATDRGNSADRAADPGAELTSASVNATNGGGHPPSNTGTAAASTPTTTDHFHGVNLSGAEFGTALPGRAEADYAFPTHAEVDYYMAKGFDTFRIPFLWERVQRAAYGAFDATHTGKLDDLVTYATSKGAHVVLDPQNFARYYGQVIGSAEVPNAVFADFWQRMSAKYVANPRVIFNLVNEPHDLPTEQWVSSANAAIVAIRSTGATNTILAPGNGWTGAHSWTKSDYGTSNAVAMLKIDDPQNNTLFEVHQYLDSDSSGTLGTCVSTTIGRERLGGFVKWLRDNGKKGFVGELGGGRNATCAAAVSDMLSYMTENEDVLRGWLWWGAGPWWGDYDFALDPSGGKDRPQMALLTPFL